jgi:hypothetical protein
VTGLSQRCGRTVKARDVRRRARPIPCLEPDPRTICRKAPAISVERCLPFRALPLAVTMHGQNHRKNDGRLRLWWSLATVAALALLGFLLYEVWYYTIHTELVPLHVVVPPLEVPRSP